MSTEVIMPTLGLTMETGTIVEWLKAEGDLVAKDEPLFVVETDKAAMEVPAPANGVLERIIAPAGAEVPVRQAIAVIADAAGEVRDAGTGRHGDGETRVEGRLRSSPAARRVAREMGVELAGLRDSGPEGRIVQRDVLAVGSASPPASGLRPPPAEPRIVASPLARKLAAEHGVDLAGLQGSGPGGRIVEKDVLAAASVVEQEAPSPAAGRRAAAAPLGGVRVPAEQRTEPLPLGRLRRITAERMAASAAAVARVTLFMPVDMSEAVRFRNQLAAEFAQRYGARLGYDAMFARAAAMALREHPALNSQWADGAVRQLGEVNIGTAVALEDGLLVVVIRQADSKPLHEVQSELSALLEKARAGSLGPDDLTGSSFTITNLGSYGVETFTPIVNLPEAAILGVGRIARVPAVVDDQIAIREEMSLSLAFDHRVTDGAPAARFLRRIREILEAPYILLTVDGRR
jgi:pyruvate dehydrogenase E2 component (dihydrolipoamide acetyltransferase)